MIIRVLCLILLLLKIIFRSIRLTKGMIQSLRKISGPYIGGIILAIALISYLTFAIAFLHVHINPAGYLNFHSHPFAQSSQNPANGPGHNHTNFEFLYFYLLTLLDKLILLALFVFLIILLQQRIKKPANIIIPLSGTFSFYSNRAPPSFSAIPV